ncbi:MAG: S-layer homology domain-containing protein [Phormidium tanganyikae FI6-MK23]|jgi:hypothetical protein|nr:S-layer homology domain-containing protein [Phormidium tanganyikae FI6-MK23]
MLNLKRDRWMQNAALLGVSITTGSIALLASTFAPSTAQNTSKTFPDTQNYWAQPFIESLANRNIIKGYPDGTFRPEQTVDRDEFAAILRAAFNEPEARRIASGSDYRDIPQRYWAAPAIKEAYQAGFMSGYPGGYFRPQQPVTKAEALVSLAQTLELNSKAPTNNQSAIAAPANNQTPTQASNKQTARRSNRGFMLPLASTMMLQPFINPIRQAAAAIPVQQNATPPQPTAKASTPQQSFDPSRVNQYYVDADRIPSYAVKSVAEATRSNVVVNHPNVRRLNPERPATRGEVAAIVHQALVNQGKVPPLGQNVPSSQYVVRAENVSRSR